MRNLKPLARKLRKNATDTENLLWNSLRSKRFGGLKFRRQAPIGHYILDFVCFEKRIIIECGGGQHMEQKEKNEKRDKWFSDKGYRVLRFWDNQILQSLEIVLEEIHKACVKPPPPLTPSPKGGGK